MSHSGIRVIVRNTGAAMCSIPLRPEIAFEDAQHRSLGIGVQAAPSMRPGTGPAPQPLAIPAGASVASELRWVSGEVYEHNQCLSPAFLSLAIGDARLAGPFQGRLCGPQQQGPEYSATNFKALATPAAIRQPEPGVLCDCYLCADAHGVSRELTAKYLGQARADKLFSQGEFDLARFALANGVYCDTRARLCRKDRYYGADGKPSGAVSGKYTKALFGHARNN